MAASLLPDSTFCIFPSPLPFIFSSVPFLLTYLSCSPSQVAIIQVTAKPRDYSNEHIAEVAFRQMFGHRKGTFRMIQIYFCMNFNIALDEMAVVEDLSER